MRRLASFTALAVIGAALGQPTLVGAQASRPTDIVGTWRNIFVHRVDWDSVAKTPLPRWTEAIVTLRADSTYMARVWQTDDAGNIKEDSSSWWGWKFGGATGKWHLNGDTLVTGMVASASKRKIVTRSGDMLTLADELKQEWSWERVDTAKAPSPLRALPPATLIRSDLVGTWVATYPQAVGGKMTDTVMLRADSTWAADASYGGSVMVGCSNVDKAKGKPSVNGVWYLGPANTIELVDAAGQRMCGAVGRWRGDGAVKLQGQQLTPVGQSQIPSYTRVSPSAP